MKNDMPLVSVLMPCYNHEAYVEDAVIGILNQTYKNIELIIIDDGSNDESAQIIQKLAEEHHFYFKTRSNKGLTPTLNELLSLANGKYISICASDDIFMPDKIKKQVRFMETNTHYGMCYGKIKCFTTSIDTTFDYELNAKQGWIFTDLLLNCFIPAPSTFIRKDVLDELGGYDERLWIEDWDLWLRISQKYQIGFIDEFFTYYRVHDENISKQLLRMYESEKKILEKYICDKSNEKILNLHRLNWFSQLSKYHKKEALKYLYPSIKYIFLNKTFIKGLYKLLFTR